MFSKISIMIGVIAILSIFIFGFIFFEPTFTEEVIDINVVSKEKWVGENAKYFIFTDSEVLLNENNYYHSNKTNADDLFSILKVGSSYKVKVVGLYIPFLPRFRNILTVIDKNDMNYRVGQN